MIWSDCARWLDPSLAAASVRDLDTDLPTAAAATPDDEEADDDEEEEENEEENEEDDGAK